jgi:EmrB/QacA subfamily drug resistance transporter
VQVSLTFELLQTISCGEEAGSWLRSVLKVRMTVRVQKSNKWVDLLIICMGIFISSLDSSIVNLANPTLVDEFGVGMDQVQWVVSVYLLVVSASMLFFGRLGDKVGGYKVFNCGFLIFTLGSLFCGVSSSLYLLLISRVIQAVGASMLMATGMGIVATSFPLKQRGLAFGLTVVAVGLGNMGGPGIGGVILHYLSWHYIFLVNVPLGVLSSLFGLLFLRSPLPNDRRSALPLDWVGSLLIAIFISLLILVISQSVSDSVWFILALPVLVPLLWFIEKRHKAPILDFALLHNRRFSLANALAFLAYFSFTTVFFLMPFYLEQVRLIPAAIMGLLIMASPLLMALVSPLSGRLSDKLGTRRIVPVGFLLLLIAFVLMSLLGAESTMMFIALSLGLLGAGIGMLNSPLNSEILTSAGPENSGYASGFLATTRNLAYCLGAACAAGIFALLFGVFSQSLGYVDAYLDTFRCIALAAAVLSLLGCLVSFRLKR